MVEDPRCLVAALAVAVEELQAAELAEVEPRALLDTMRQLEVVRRRLDAATDGLVARCEATAAYFEDGHKSTKSFVKAVGRLPGGEALGRVQTVRALPCLPEVSAAYASGKVPTGCVRAIARVAANPRVRPFLEIADPIFAEMASSLTHDEFCDWLRQWEELADADGAGEAAELGHERRHVSLVRNDIDGTWHLEGDLGDLQGTVMADIFEAFCEAELDADLAWAKEHIGDDFTLDQLPRTPRQRRADALFAIFRRAMAQPADAKDPEPLVSIVIDDETLEREIARAAGVPVADDPARIDDAMCHTVSGDRLHASAALAALVVGHVRRVVVDSAKNVIDLGRKRRLFVGSSREAAKIQALLRDRGGTGCGWPGCDTGHRRLQVDHRRSFGQGGPTDVDNSGLYCGVHNRLKETGFRPVLAPDGTWTIIRPDDTPTTPAA